jgi:hypothetical protein
MEYDKSCLNDYDSDKYVEILKKKKIENFTHEFNTKDTDLFYVITNLQNKVKELDSKIEFFKKYQNKLDSDMDYKIKDTIYALEQVIIELDKNIVEKAQIKTNRKNNFIELEF